MIIGGIACSTKNQVFYMTNDAQTIISADSTGIYTNNFIFAPELLFPKKKWSGEWIWLNQKTFPQYQNTFTQWINSNPPGKQYRALFRKEFDVNKIPDKAILCLTADVSFRAFVNGDFVCQGPANIGSDYDDNTPPEHCFFTMHDVREHLLAGKNSIAVEVYSYDLALCETTSGEGKLICDLNIDLDNTILSTDSTWKCKVDTSLIRKNDTIFYNATIEVADWQNNNFSDKDWAHVSIKKIPKDGYLLKSEIPTPIRYPLEAAKIWVNSPGKEIDKKECKLFDQIHYEKSFTLDFVKNMPAYYTISLTAHEGDRVQIFPREKYEINRPLEYICKNGLNKFTTPQLNVFRYLTVNVVSKKGLIINSLYALYSSYPVSYAGSFSCSDTFYTKLWDITRWTTQMCMNSLYLDSPKHQEPIACTGDYLIESLSNYYAFGDPWLARQDLLKTAKMLKKNNYDMFHTSYSLLWVQMLYNYFQYTGDTRLVTDLLPHVNQLNDLFETYLDDNFLVTQAPDYMFMDWIKINKYNAHHPPAVIGMGYLSAFFYKSLLDAAYLNELNNNHSKSRANIQLAQKIKAGINNFLWEKNKGIYKDGIPFQSHIKSHQWLPADENITTYSPHINTLAVLYDIAPKNHQVSIMEYVVSQQDIELQPYFMYFVLSAITHIKNFDTDGLALINKWKNGIDLETFTLKENWQDRTEFGYSGDFSHAWGGSPLYFMSSQILGIKPEEPGYKKIRFDPYVSDYLTWAKGTVPLKDGKTISVNWQRSAQSKYTYSIKIPHNYRVLLYHPEKLKSFSILVNNKKCEKGENSLELSQGEYVIKYTKIGN